MLKPKNCPFCKSAACVRPLDGGPGIGVDSYYVQCMAWNCNASGPHGSAMEYFKAVGWDRMLEMPPQESEEIARDDAIAKWNAVCDKLEGIEDGLQNQA